MTTAPLEAGLDHPAVDQLATYHRNPRRGNVDRIAESLRVNGQYRPIVVNRGTHTGRPNEVLAGNHTLMAARSLGWATVAAVWVDVDDEQASRIVAADNRTADLGDYDDRLLLELLAELPDLDGTGYDAGDLEELERALAAEELPGAGATDPDEVPAAPKHPRSEVGDVWELGPHRLVVGDSTDVGVWDRLLDGGKADAVWTDPPYGVAIVGGNHSLSPEQRRAQGGKEIQNDTFSGDELAEFLRGAFAAALAGCRTGAVWYVAAPPGPLFLPFAQVLTELEVWRQTLVWAKDSLVMGRSDYHYRHEAVFYGWTPGAAHQPPPDRKQDTVHEVARPKRSEDHPTMKPVELIHRHLANSTQPLDVVADPFGGSGSTLIACHQLNRKARLIELDPRYADVICRRYQEHTGTKPTRDGQPHDFTQEARDG